MSENLKALVLDVKCGKGCFNKTMEVAEELANSMVRVGEGLGIKTTAFITEMDNPIGKAVGNSVEVAEALQCLDGNGPADLEELVCKQGMYMNQGHNFIIFLGVLEYILGVSEAMPAQGFRYVF